LKISDYAEQRGYVVVEWVEALDESASRSRSPWWARLDAAVEKIEGGQADVILVWRLSRAARHRRRWAVAADRVDVAGGSIESATEQIDARTSTGRLARGMLAELAAWEADVKSEIWKETVERRRRVGLAHSTYPRLGYRIVDRAYVVDDDTTETAAGLYRRFIAGDGAVQLASWLNRSGVLQPRSGGRWEPKTVRRFLDSGFAAGKLRVGDSYIEGAHPAIIDERTWRAYLRAREARRTTPARLVTPSHALSGLVRCPGCDRALRVKRMPARAGNHDRPGRPRRPMLSCETFGCERRGYVSADRAVRSVLDWLRPLAQDVDVSRAVLAAAAAQRAVAKTDRTRLRRKAAQIDTQLTRLTLDLTAGVVRPKEYTATRDALLAAQADVEAALAALESVTERPPPSPRRVARLLDAWGEMSDVGRNRALRELIARVDLVPQESGRALIRPLGTWEVVPDR